MESCARQSPPPQLHRRCWPSEAFGARPTTVPVEGFSTSKWSAAYTALPLMTREKRCIGLLPESVKCLIEGQVIIGRSDAADPSAVKQRPEAKMIAAGKEHQRAVVAIIAVRDFGDEQRVVTYVEMPYHLAGEERDVAGKSWQTVDDVVVGARAGRRAARKMLRKSSTTFGQHVDAIAAARRNRLVHPSGHDGDEYSRRLEADGDKAVCCHAADVTLLVEGGQYRDTRDAKPNLEQFAMDAWRTPKLVLRAHPPDQHAQFHLDSRAPSPRVRFPTPIATKAGSVPMQQRFGLDNCDDLQNRRKPSIHLNEEPAIIVREPDATMQTTPQNNQLMSKHRVLRLKPQLRLEWRGQDSKSETEQPDHAASLGDSITSSTQIGFSAHTTDAPERGGLLRSSEEAAVMVVERRGRVIDDESGQLATGGARSSTEGGSLQSMARAGIERPLRRPLSCRWERTERALSLLATATLSSCRPSWSSS